jgi:hypothetical protein
MMLSACSDDSPELTSRHSRDGDRRAIAPSIAGAAIVSADRVDRPLLLLGETGISEGFI